MKQSENQNIRKVAPLLSVHRALVRNFLSTAIADAADGRRNDWSTQGLGMLRLYLSREVRLHVWHSAFRVPSVSDIHDHPWDFRSDIVCGSVRNVRYGIVSESECGPVLQDGEGNPLGAVARPGQPNYTQSTIRCGTGRHRQGLRDGRFRPRVLV